MFSSATGLYSLLKENVHLDCDELGAYLTKFIEGYSANAEQLEDDITFSIIAID
ncbi:MAG: hypothetical protein ABUK01_17915 [Leptospirales bacterium]